MRPRILLTLFIAAFAFLATGVAQSQSANDLFQEAWRFQESKGDLAKAIDLYRTLVDRYPNAAVAPKALIGLAECYEKLGRPEAADVYRQVISRYANSGAPASSARARLAAIDQKSGPAVTVRRVWNTSPGGTGGVSSDGRFITFVSWDKEGAIGVHDLSSGKSRNLTAVTGPEGPPDEYGATSKPSPDGRSIAYVWNISRPDWRAELRVISPNGGPFKILDSNAEKAVQIRVWGWTSDSRAILVTKSIEAPGAGPATARRTDTLLLIPVNGGTTTQIKQFAPGEATGGFDISPDGRYVAYAGPAAAGRPESALFLLSLKDGVVTQLTHQSDDRLLNWLPDGSGILLNSDRTGTFGIWSMAISNGQPAAQATLIKPDTGPIAALGFTRKGDFYYETAEQIEDISIASIDPATGKQTGVATRLEGRYVGGKQHGVWSPDGGRIAYFQNVRMGSAGRTATPANNRRLAIHTLATGEVRLWDLQLRGNSNPAWSRDGRSVFINATDTENRQGLIQIDVETGAKTPVAMSQMPAGPGRILPAAGLDGHSVFFHLVLASPKMLELRDGGGIASLDLVTGTETIVVPDRLTAFAVSPDGRWIARTITRDGLSQNHLAIIPTSGGEPKALAAGVADWTLRGPVAWSPDGRFVYVVRTDLPVNEEIVQVPLDGSAPRRTGIVWSGRTGRLDVHPDGRRIAVSTEGFSFETWVLPSIKK